MKTRISLPNKITIFRFIAIPFFVMAMLYHGRTGSQSYYLAALAIFVAAVISDGLDGYFARTRGLHSELGKIIDPLADKLLLNSAVILLAFGIGELFRFPAWFAVLVISRDLMIVGGSAIVVLLRGKVEIRPTGIGKFAAVSQMAAVVWVMLILPGPVILVYVSAVLTVFSVLPYLRFGLRQIEGRPPIQPGS